MKPRLRRLAALFLLYVASSAAFAGTVEEDWQAVVTLDAGPSEQVNNPQAIGPAVLSHLARQETALRRFLAAHPKDTHAFEAELRLARLLQMKGDFEDSEKPRLEAARLFEELEKTATPEQRPEVEFSKLARFMRTLQRSDATQVEALLNATRRFQHDYPNDRRLGALLVEVATLFDAQPATKETLLEDAQAVATDGDLRARIADDLTRTRLMGKEVPLEFTSIQGQQIKLESLLGRPAFIIFFAGASPPAVAAIGKIQQAVADLPAGSVRVVGVSLDMKRETLAALLKAHNVTWPVAFDGKGWEGPLVRGLGINALPTVWLLDGRGRLRSLNALDGAADMARQVMQDR